MRSLSTTTGIPYRSLHNYLSGSNRMPADVYVQICRTLGVDTQYITQASFHLQAWPLFDALWAVFGDGLFDLRAYPAPPAYMTCSATARRRPQL